MYLVLDDFGRIGRAYVEADEESSDRGSVIRRMIEGQYNNPVRIVAFNTSEGWSRDVSEAARPNRMDRVSNRPCRAEQAICAVSCCSQLLCRQ